MTILKAPKVSNWSKFDKNKDNLRLHLRVYADLFGIRFSRLRPFLIFTYKFRFNEPNFRSKNNNCTVINCNVTLNIKLCNIFTSLQLETRAYEIVNLNLQA